MFRLLLVILAAIGLVSIFGGIGLWALLLVPVLLFALVGCPMRSRRSRSRWTSRAATPAGKSNQDGFDDWHRMAHAREEVDSWVDGLPSDKI